MVDDKLNVVGVTQGAIWGDKLPAIAVVVRDGTVEDSEAFGSGVVLPELSDVQVSVEGVSLRGGRMCVDEDWLWGQRRRRRQRRWCLGGLRGGRAQAVTEGEWGGGAFDAVNEGRRGSHGASDNGGRDGKVAYGGGVGFIEFFQELISVDVGGGFPAIVRFGETFPPDKVL